MTVDEKPEDTSPPSEKPHHHQPIDDEEIDEALEDTFPASDPPAFIAGLPKTE